MKRQVGVVVFATATWFGSGRAPSAESDRYPLSMTWSDAHGLVARPDAVREEVRAILAHAGIDATWEPTPGQRPILVVMTPSEPSGPGWNLSPSVMGVYLTDGRADSVFVFFERVSKTVGRRGQADGLRTARQRRLVERALGRVIVHELVHRLAPDLPHAAHGLLRSRLNRSALTSARLGLDAASARAVRRALGERARTCSPAR